jgi:NAD+ kinase
MKIGIIANPEKSLAKKILPELIKRLKEKGGIPLPETILKNILYVEPLFSIDKIREESDVVLALGGDGTLLRAARIILEKETPILGINLGSLGFLADIEVDRIWVAIQNLMDRKYEIEKRMTLEVSVSRNHFFALNDIVISHSTVGRMIDMEIFMNGKLLTTVLLDGLIISTPTGSTAYNLASQGPILHPGLSAIIVNPICPHSLSFRPMVLSQDSIIEIQVRKGDAILTADGQREAEIEKSNRYCVKRGKYYVNLIKTGEKSFFEILKTKLKWG